MQMISDISDVLHHFLPSWYFYRSSSSIQRSDRHHVTAWSSRTGYELSPDLNWFALDWVIGWENWNNDHHPLPLPDGGQIFDRRNSWRFFRSNCNFVALVLSPPGFGQTPCDFSRRWQASSSLFGIHYTTPALVVEPCWRLYIDAVCILRHLIFEGLCSPQRLGDGSMPFQGHQWSRMNHICSPSQVCRTSTEISCLIADRNLSLHPFFSRNTERIKQKKSYSNKLQDLICVWIAQDSKRSKKPSHDWNLDLKLQQNVKLKTLMILMIESLVTSVAAYMLRISCSPLVENRKSQKSVMFSKAEDRIAESTFMRRVSFSRHRGCWHSFDWHWLWGWKYERIEY